VSGCTAFRFDGNAGQQQPLERTVFRKSYRLILGLLAVAVVGCNSPVPTESSTAWTPVGGSTSDLKLNLPLPPVLGCLLGGPISLDIGPQGGTISLGAATLSIPAHALLQQTHILMLPALGNTIAVQFFPEGLLFNKNAPAPTLTFNTDCIGNPATAYIVYTDDAGNILERLPSTRTAHGVSAQIHHFSRYAVAW
jgi:hypothetical protein